MLCGRAVRLHLHALLAIISVMSWVTNAILMHGSLEISSGDRRYRIIDDLHAAMARAGITSGEFVRVDQYARGTKAMEAAVYVAAFNHLDEKTLIATIRSLPWEHPDWVQLFLRRQEEERFTETALFHNEPTRRQKEAAGKGMALQGPADQAAFGAKLTVLIDTLRAETQANPLRPTTWQVVEVDTLSPWSFEITRIGAETIFSVSRPKKVWTGRPDQRPWEHLMVHHFSVALAYRGNAAELVCDSEVMGEGPYAEVKSLLENAAIGDELRFLGRVAVQRDWIWHLRATDTTKIAI